MIQVDHDSPHDTGRVRRPRIFRRSTMQAAMQAGRRDEPRGDRGAAHPQSAPDNPSNRAALRQSHCSRVVGSTGSARISSQSSW
ncbi:hypothetical protein BZL29_1010 [Mycobacterium kansasii]|uniref:Uncharacterized protein n=1 Tax=Mycobacterium kansasii TaxID=1768 RepID=A0A1V3Y0M1_MYCKA|nr:hypothetical protein BZL29_1010 [Mycobacterium kansasii]